ncbi:hypothetical protein TIFTF001_019517 [Ficus carica]|uniref:Uncharacterized protein n=1 Tax=Ficus carica TaxID=3494 RepID=A0AA88DCS3_FICCA|nr:hypothetical protein TIFTF001_019517 [Ficus carica]
MKDHNNKTVAVVKAKKEEVTLDPEPKPEPRFKPKIGSVFPKKRRSVKRLMLDYAQLRLFGSTSADTSNGTGTASSAALFPTEEINAVMPNQVYPHME